MATTTDTRILLEVPLQPAIGQRFQPTGFPDLGAADYDVPTVNGVTHNLLVESAQSMANHLEGVAWDLAEQEPVPDVAGLPYVRVVNSDGEYLTSSRTESHRLASAFIKEATLDGASMIDVIKDRLGLQQDHPLDHRAIAKALFSLDPFVLLHGVFFADSKWPGQPKVARAVTSFVEAHNVERAESGGVKRDHVRHSIEDGKGGSDQGYGSVPFARTEWTAESIFAYFSVDLMQLAGYGLSEDATELLRNLALWEIRHLLDGGLRLRTACDLMVVPGSEWDEVVPAADALSAAVRQGIEGTRAERGESSVLEVVWSGGAKTKKDS